MVDDASDYDVSRDLAQLYPSVKVIRNEVRRFISYSRNAGSNASNGKYVFFLDDDNVIAANAVSELVKPLEATRAVGVCAPLIFYLRYPTRVWTSVIRPGRIPGTYALGTETPASIASTFSFHNSFMVRRSAFEQLDGFDHRTFPMHFSELDFAYRLRQHGYRAVVNPSAKVWHDVARTQLHVDSRRSYYTIRNRILLMRKYASKPNFAFYIACVQPLFAVYYAAHHALASSDDRLLAVYNLFRGLVDGMTLRTPSPLNGSGARPSSPRSPRARVPEGVTPHPLVSVLVPTSNSALTLERCLRSLKAQTYLHIEVIVIDNHSRDNTVSIAKSIEGVKVLEAGPERSAQVNLGARVSKGEYIYRVDSDFVLEPTVIEEAVRKCIETGSEALTVHNESDPTISFWSAVRKLERDCYEDDATNVAARFFERKVFTSLGGFNENLIASEDYDLHNRIVRAGYKIGRIKAKEIHIGEPKRLSDVVRKHVFYGKQIDKFIRLNPKVSLRQLSPLRIAYVRHWRDFIRDPSLTVGFVLYQYVRYMAAAAGYIETKT